MAAVVPSADQATDLLKNLSLDSQTKTLEIPEPAKKTSVNSGNGQVQPSNRSGTPLIPDYMDPSVGYSPNAYASNAYYYGGYDGSTIDWEEYSKYMNPDGVDLSHGLYGYGYAPYGPYSPAGSPVPTIGQDGQFYSTQHYQYPNSYYPQLTPSGGPYAAAPNSKGVITTPSPADKSSISVDPTKATSNGTKGNTGSAPVKPTPYQNSGYNANGSYGRGAQNSYQDPRYGFDGVHSQVPWLDSSMYSDPKTRNSANNTPGSYGNSAGSRNFMSPRPMTGLNTASGYMYGMHPNKLYNQYGSTYQSGYGYGSNWLTVDNKYKPRGRGNGFFGYNNENSDGLNELNRGPRARTIKNQKLFTPIAIAVKDQTVTLPTTETLETEVKEVSLAPDREQYNKSDFPETYADAKFLIIKSYSEDDVHKSIKYNMWASTQNGNKKLNAAYKEAQQKSEPCPVFLFFSVNTSGQFVGVAEMVGPVDFDKSLEYWQQDKWIGCFPVKWHIVKDVPNSLLKHIILEYNENKPVTNSRDTQEVKLEQGLQVVKVFKEHSSKQSILDDFEFYEDRQKKIQEKKAKQQFQKQTWEGKPAIDEKIKEGIKVEVPKSADAVTDSVNDVKVADNVQDVAEKKVIVNVVAIGH